MECAAQPPAFAVSSTRRAHPSINARGTDRDARPQSSGLHAYTRGCVILPAGEADRHRPTPVLFPLARVVFGFQCQQCGEEHRIGLNGSDLRRLAPREAESLSSQLLACSKCGATGNVQFSADRTSLDWIEPEIS
jgi:hypothetical protein